MTKKELEDAKYIPIRIKQLDKQIAHYQRRAESVVIIAGQVQTSQKEWPYLPSRETVEIPEPKSYTFFQRKIIERENEKRELEDQLERVETFIASIQDLRARTMFTELYLHDKSQEVVGGLLGISQSRVSQIIEEILNH